VPTDAGDDSGAVNWLEHPSIADRCQSGASIENAPEERRVLITHIGADLVGGAFRGFEQAFGFFDAQK
jgi:hypothetical protein